MARVIAPLQTFAAAIGCAVAGLALDLAFAIPAHWGTGRPARPSTRPANVYSLRPGARRARRRQPRY